MDGGYQGYILPAEDHGRYGTFSALLVQSCSVAYQGRYHSGHGQSAPCQKSKVLYDNLNRKTEIKNPKVIAGMEHEGHYSIPYLSEEVYASLKYFNSLRSMNTGEKTRFINRLDRWLSIYFPEFRTVFKDVTGTGSLFPL